jgi:hypothetical protein
LVSKFAFKWVNLYRLHPGIAKEKDMGLDLEGDETNGVDKDGNAMFRKSGVDRGDGGYRCCWTVKGRSATDASWVRLDTTTLHHVIVVRQNTSS